MPKKAPTTEEVDPVRSRLAGAVAAPAPMLEIKPEPTDPPKKVVQQNHPAPKPRLTKPLPRQGTNPEPRRTTEPRVLTVNRKFMMTPEETNQIEDTIRLISQAFGSRVTYSQASRALWSLLAGAEDAMVENPRRGEPLRVPSRGDHLAMAEYEESLSQFLYGALKRS